MFFARKWFDQLFKLRRRDAQALGQVEFYYVSCPQKPQTSCSHFPAKHLEQNDVQSTRCAKVESFRPNAHSSSNRHSAFELPRKRPKCHTSPAKKQVVVVDDKTCCAPSSTQICQEVLETAPTHKLKRYSLEIVRVERKMQCRHLSSPTALFSTPKSL